MIHKEDLILLVNAWDEFQEGGGKNTLENFAIWILGNHKKRSERVDVEREVGHLSARVDRYSKARIKHAFSDLPLIGYDDFILLNTVFHHPNIPKKDLYDLNIYDMNSGTQAINRLKRDGLLTDTKSAIDKRVFLLNITQKGEEIRNSAFERLGEEVKIKYEMIDNEELHQFLLTIRKIENRLKNLRNGMSS